MSCFPRMEWIRWSVDDLSPEQMQTMKEHLSTCEKCRAISEDIRREYEAFEPQEALNLQGIKKRIREAKTKSQKQAERAVPFWRKWHVPAVTMATATAAFLVAVLVGKPLHHTHPSVRYKGAFSMQVFAKRGENHFLVKKRQPLTEGDALRFVVTADGPGYLMVVSVDKAGKVWPMYPFEDPQKHPRPWPVAKAGRHELPRSMILDDSLGREWIVAFFSPHSFDRRRLFAQLAKKGSHQLQSLTSSALGFPGKIIVLEVNKVPRTP